MPDVNRPLESEARSVARENGWIANWLVPSSRWIPKGEDFGADLTSRSILLLTVGEAVGEAAPKELLTNRLAKLQKITGSCGKGRDDSQLCIGGYKQVAEYEAVVR